ncbi:MAG TPA: hypothetical protein PLQ35_09230 [bacterium]|nr:hypothetical protein [bacterium]HQL62463.1 hypothetical protein [bacterium]
MNEKEAKALCLNLMQADSEDEVIQILKEAGYWDNPDVWRFYGDYENNYNTIGNQQGSPDAALVEKLVNSVDARLMNECLVRGTDPEGPNAPQSIQEAVARFFGNATEGKSSLMGCIRDWMDSKRTDIARGITLAATGAKPGSGNPSFTIADMGEGQTPDKMPDTLLSLNKSNKLRIHFVQGKFNMGGTGVLKFCGKHSLQLVLSRRNPVVLQQESKKEQDENKWSFTVVRREDPEGNRRSSVYTYLAPLGAESRPKEGEILRFFAEELPIFPDGRDAYARKANWGTLIKLYEYSATGFKSHILMKDGLLSRVDLLLPDIALPMRFHECRDYSGHEGSFETTLTGVRVRLDEDKGKNLENGFPVGAPIKVMGEEMRVTIYAFRKKGSEAYRKNEGIIFIVNGQTHGYLTQDFFSRKRVGLSYLADSILVIVDCTKLSGRAREDLFMNSRDRLSRGDLRQQIEERLEELLKQHQGLRELKERRRREEIESKLDDEKPLEDILENLLKQSPILSNLFLRGLRASTPFKTMETQAGRNAFKGRRFPMFFKFKGKDYGYVLRRDCHINMRCRLVFETDAENEYFSRAMDPGEFRLTLLEDKEEISVQDYLLNLQDGIATLSLPLPDHASVGQTLCYLVEVNDCSRIEPFMNKFHAIVKEEQLPCGGTDSRREPPSEEEGEGREKPSRIRMPKVILVEEKDWHNYTPPFDKHTAMIIRNAGTTEEDGEDSDSSILYDFHVNMDNLYLKTELKIPKAEPELVRAQFKYGMVLMGLAFLRDDMEDQRKRSENKEQTEDRNGSGATIEEKVEEFCRAVAPVIIPMINSLGSLSAEDEHAMAASGEAT